MHDAHQRMHAASQKQEAAYFLTLPTPAGETTACTPPHPAKGYMIKLYVTSIVDVVVSCVLHQRVLGAASKAGFAGLAGRPEGGARQNR